MHVAAQFAWVIGAIFALGTVAIALTPSRSARARHLWALLALELAQIGLVLLPAFIGTPVVELVYGLIAFACARELRSCLRAGGFSLPAQLALVFGIVGLGMGALLSIARTSFLELALGYALVEINDTAAFAVGSALGRHKLWPRVSPNKTFEGLLGGLTASVVLALLLGFMVPGWPAAALVFAGLLMALTGTAGDLIASAFKRKAGVRNYSSVIPVQGGVLDLYDSAIFAAPAWLLYLTWMRSVA